MTSKALVSELKPSEITSALLSTSNTLKASKALTIWSNIWKRVRKKPFTCLCAYKTAFPWGLSFSRSSGRPRTDSCLLSARFNKFSEQAPSIADASPR